MSGVETNLTCAGARGMTLVEVVLSMLIVSFVLASLMQGVGLSARFQQASSDQIRGTILARDLADRIAAYPYAEPAGAAGLPGLDAAEIAGDAATFDDVDDFHGYSESPPLLPDGTVAALPGVWVRGVRVELVEPTAPDAVAVSDMGAKRITVSVTHNGKPVGVAVRLRYRSGELGAD